MSDKEVLLRLTVEGNQANKELAQNNHLLELNNQERKELNEQYKTGGISAKNYHRQISNLNVENKRLQNSNRALTRSAVAQRGSIAALRGEYSMMRERLNNAVVGMNITQKEFDQLKAKAFQAQVAIRNFDRSISGANQLVGEYDRGMSKASKATNFLRQNLGMLGVTLGGAALVGGLRKSINLFIAQEKAERQLATSLGFTSTKLMEQASALQQMTTFGDEATMQAQALLAGFGLTEDQLLSLTPALQDFAALQGIDVVSAATKLNNVLNGTSSTLRGTSVNLSVTASRAERFHAVMNALTEDGIKGQAQALAQTEGGQLEQLQNRFGDMAEILGAKVLPIINDVFSFLLDNSGLVVKAIGGITAAFLVLNAAAAANPIGLIVKGIAAGIAFVISFKDEIVSLGYAVTDFLGITSESERSLERYNEQLKETRAAAKAAMEAYQLWKEQLKEFPELYERFQNSQKKLQEASGIKATLRALLDHSKVVTQLEKDLEKAKEEEKNREEAAKRAAEEAIKARRKEIEAIQKLRDANKLAQLEGLELLEEKKRIEIREAQESIKNADLLKQTLIEIEIKYGIRREEIIQARRDKEIEQENALIEDRKKRAEEAAKKNIDIAKKEAEGKIKTKEQQQDLELQLASQSLELFKGLFENQKEAQKAFSIGETLINTYTAAAAAVAPPPLGLGPVRGFPLAALTVASGLAKVAKIASFQDGGILVGPSHSQGGIPIKMSTGGVVEAEGGEAIINKRSMRSNVKMSVTGTPRRIASQINQVGGGRRFRDGGILTESITSPVDQDNNALISTRQFLKSLPKPVVNITDIRQANNLINVTDNIGRI